jgi:hypothetical protein
MKQYMIVDGVPILKLVTVARVATRDALPDDGVQGC